MLVIGVMVVDVPERSQQGCLKLPCVGESSKESKSSRIVLTLKSYFNGKSEVSFTEGERINVGLHRLKGDDYITGIYSAARGMNFPVYKVPPYNEIFRMVDGVPSPMTLDEHQSPIALPFDLAPFKTLKARVTLPQPQHSQHPQPPMQAMPNHPPPSQSPMSGNPNLMSHPPPRMSGNPNLMSQPPPRMSGNPNLMSHPPPHMSGNPNPLSQSQSGMPGNPHLMGRPQPGMPGNPHQMGRPQPDMPVNPNLMGRPPHFIPGSPDSMSSDGSILESPDLHPQMGYHPGMGGNAPNPHAYNYPPQANNNFHYGQGDESWIFEYDPETKRQSSE
ncbi:proline-rich protein 2-like [Belonocnema kinseyi]|uniref:proline-rich protein 2-like n=1 Tax=Belonocnema kinseyi TaxID=2817044 RepID=UPI00143D48F8|nr:proline-rich protein 2-like [Belonocnema kinseyi]